MQLHVKIESYVVLIQSSKILAGDCNIEGIYKSLIDVYTGGTFSDQSRRKFFKFEASFLNKAAIILVIANTPLS